MYKMDWTMIIILGMLFLTIITLLGLGVWIDTRNCP